MNWIVAALAIVASLDIAQRSHQYRTASQRDRVVAGIGVVAAVVAVAAVATPLLDALDISGPNMQIGAGVVLGVVSILAFVTWDDEPSPAVQFGGLVPLVFPIVLTPVVGVVALAVGSRNGLLVPALASGAAAVPLAWPASSTAVARRPFRMLTSTVGVVVAVAMIVDGAFDV